MPRKYGRVLTVNLSDRSFNSVDIDQDVLKKFIGGAGLSAHLYRQIVKSDVPALSPESPFIAMTGPLTGTSAVLSGRHGFAGRSPLTNFWGHASVGGHWGVELRRTGLDGLVVLGKAQKPTSLFINNGKLEFIDAEKLWGLDTFETDSAIKVDLGKKVKVCTIGPAGENLVKFAGIFTDGAHARTAARCGLGALMGSKNLKAIALRGTDDLPVMNRNLLQKNVKELLPHLKKKLQGMSQFGTPGLVIPCEAMGDLPIKNWTQGKWTEGANKIGANELNSKYLKKRFYCAGCVVGCGRTVGGVLDENLSETGGPEYETLAMLGSNCMIEDLSSLLKLNELVNRLGLDSIETGAIIAFCMELYDRGLIGYEQLGSIDLKWGNAKGAENLIKLIAKRERIGNLLAEGLKSSAEKIGGTASEYAIHSNNMALPAHDPRAYSSIALGYATSSRGPCHTDCFSHIFERATIYPEAGIERILDRFKFQEKADMVIKAQNLMHLWENLALCKFAIFGGVQLYHISEWIKHTLGWKIDPEGLMEAGNRSFQLKRMLNVRWGWSRKNDSLPDRILTHRVNDGGAGDHLPPINIMLADYYELRGWSKEGIPMEQTLKALGL